jgi:hypothetical protein
MRGFPMSWAQGRLVRISRTNIFTELRVAASVVLPSKTPVMPRRRSGRLPALREFALRDRARRSRTTCGGDRTTDHGLLTGRGVRQSWRPGRCRPCRPVLLRYLRNSCRALSHDRLDSPPPVAGADLLLPAGERHLARPTSCAARPAQPRRPDRRKPRHPLGPVVSSGMARHRGRCQLGARAGGSAAYDVGNYTVVASPHRCVTYLSPEAALPLRWLVPPFPALPSTLRVGRGSGLHIIRVIQ